MKIKTRLHIGRDSSNTFKIEISDEASGIEFLEIRMSPHDFAMALSNMCMSDIDAEVRGLENVGKVKVSEKRSIICPISFGREKQREWLQQNAQEDGEILDAYLGSQGSVTRDADGNTVLNYRVFKYVDVEEAK